MKKVLFGMMGAIALAFTACTSEEELAPVNPTFDGKAVKTQFTLNVGQGQFATRMTAANTQANNNDAESFLGMENMVLYAFSEVPTGVSQLTTSFQLGEIAAKEITNDHSNKFYTLQIPVGTNNFVFYGEGPSDEQKADTTGILDANTTDAEALNGLSFNLVKRAADDLFTGETAKAIIDKLNAVAAAEGTIGEGNDAEKKAWAASDDEILKAMYTAFTTIGSDTIRAGYDAAVNRMLTDLKTAATQLKNTGLTDEAKAIAKAIEDSIGTFEASNFPGAKMPAGAAQLVFSNNKFSYKGTPDLFKSETVNPQKIAYPAQLVYWTSSLLRATDNEKVETDYPDGVSNWINDENTLWADWTTGAVKATTRAIAMKQNINYGVAGLHSTVDWTKTTNGKLADNTSALVEGATDSIFTISANSFELTGILVGGQPSEVDWQLLPAAGTADAPPTFDWVVYDNTVTGNESYTLLLDNYQATTKPVLVALEFTNKLGSDFYGKDGIIPAGGTFYLVGKLETDVTAWEEPYEKDSRVQNAIRIFAQDRMTEASFKFTDDALKNAYETIPDLQSISMLFGLSVDIKWLKGLNFTDVPL